MKGDTGEYTGNWYVGLNLNFVFSKSMNLNFVFSKSMNLNFKMRRKKMNGSNPTRYSYQRLSTRLHNWNYRTATKISARPISLY